MCTAAWALLSPRGGAAKPRRIKGETKRIGKIALEATLGSRAASVPLFCHLSVLLTEAKWKCSPPDGMWRGGLLRDAKLSSCISWEFCGICCHLTAFPDGKEQPSVSVQRGFRLLKTVWSLGSGVCRFVFSSVKTDVISLDSLEGFSHPAVVIGSCLWNKDKFHGKCCKVSCLFSYFNDSFFL